MGEMWLIISWLELVGCRFCRACSARQRCHRLFPATKRSCVARLDSSSGTVQNRWVCGLITAADRRLAALDANVLCFWVLSCFWIAYPP